MRTAAEHQKSWNLRVVCGLLSLDGIEPFLPEIEFESADAPALRSVCREYLDAWRGHGEVPHRQASAEWRFEPDAWLDDVAKKYGNPMAKRIAELADELMTRVSTPDRHGWTELMARLLREPEFRPPSDFPSQKFEIFKQISRQHHESMKRIEERIEGFVASLKTPWDRALIEDGFFPDGDEDDEFSRFDPESWLWDLLSDKQWQAFFGAMRRELTQKEIESLVLWGRALPDSTFGRHLSSTI